MQHIKQKYLGFVLILSHTLLVFVVLNFLAWLCIEQHQEDQDFSQIYKIFNYKALKSDIPACQLDSNELVAMFESFIAFKKSGQQEFLYHPATEYQLNEFSFQDVAIIAHPSGFNTRSNGRSQEVKEKAYQIFCFGGSTTYGTFTKDSQTWPAFLEALLDSVEVVNFGVPGFVPTQETNQFIYLLKLGYRPDLVIFMDGVNIGPPYDGSDFTRQIAQKFNQNEEVDVLGSLAIVKLWNGSYKEEIHVFQTENVDFVPLESTTSFNEMVANRFVENARIRSEISELYGVPILQFLQANGNLNYPLAFYKENLLEDFKSEGAKNVSKNLSLIFEEVLEANVGYVDLSGLFLEYGKASIIDVVHYTPEFNAYVASDIKKYVPNALAKSNCFQTNAHETGLPFESN